LRGRVVGRAESLRRDETDDYCGRGGEPHDRQSIRGRVHTPRFDSIDDGRKLGCTSAVHTSKLAEPVT
jgi:hypothetical protein